MHLVIAIATLALATIAVWWDVATRTIPNILSLVILALGVVARIIEGPTALAMSAATACLVFGLLLITHARGLIGGGDVKLMTAFAVGLSPLDSYRFIIATAIAGGLLAIAYLLLSTRLRGLHSVRQASLLGRIAAIESWRIRKRGPLPYGVAIAVGGAFVLLHPGSF